jgi:hypothetical protein
MHQGGGNVPGHIVTMPILNLFETQRFIDLVYPPGIAGALSVVSTLDWTGRQFLREQTAELLEYVKYLDGLGAPGIYLRATTSRVGLAQYRRGDATDALELPGLWADLDFGTDGHGDRKELPRPPDADAAASLVQIAGLPAPTLWIHSGGGLYAWWLLQQPFAIPDSHARSYLDTLSRKWQHVLAKAAASRGWFYGTEVSDLARVLRLPGTVNRKIAGRDRPARVTASDGPRYLLQDLHNAVEPLVARWGVDVALTSSGIVNKAGSTETQIFISKLVNPDGPPCKKMADTRDHWIALTRAAGASCHDECYKGSRAIASDAAKGHHGGRTAMAQFQEIWLSIRVPGTASGRVFETADQEWERAERGAWTIAAGEWKIRQTGDSLIRDQERCKCFDEWEPPPVTTPLASVQVNSPSSGSATNLPQEFWDCRPVLKHIRDAAHLRSRSADAVLGSVLARLSSILPGDLRVDTDTATPASLNFYSIILGGPASGKSTAASLAEMLFPMGYDIYSKKYSVGSGQGIAAAYGTIVEGEFKQIESQAFFTADEGSMLLKLAKSRDSIVLDTIREAWTGSEIGQKNAAAERDRRVRNYAMGLRVCLQPIHAVELFSDANVGDGTMQRFMWFSALDPSIPRGERRRGMPSEMPFDLAAANTRDPLVLPEHIKDEIRERDAAGSRGDITIEPSQEHALLRQVKTACLLAILDNRQFVTDEDWELAKVMLEVSHRVATSVREGAKQRKQQAEVGRIEAKHRELDALDARQEKKIEELVLRAIEKVKDKPGIARGALKCSLARDRDAADVAIERALDRGLLREEEVPGQTHGARIFPN